MVRDQIRSMSVTDFSRYLLRREQTHDLALQLAYVYEDRRARAQHATVHR
jgi:hypothetical protein